MILNVVLEESQEMMGRKFIFDESNQKDIVIPLYVCFFLLICLSIEDVFFFCIAI